MGRKKFLKLRFSSLGLMTVVPLIIARKSASVDIDSSNGLTSGTKILTKMI